MIKRVSLIFMCCMAGLYQPASADTIKMGYFVLKPHLYVAEDSITPQGSAIAYFNDFAEKMGYEVEWTGPLPFLRLLTYLEDGTLDGSLMIAKNDSRKKFLYYATMPFYAVQSILVLKKEHPLDLISSINDLQGFRIGSLSGVNLSPFMKRYAEMFQFDFIGGENWFEQNIQKLILGRIDAIYGQNAVTPLYEATILDLDESIKILALPEPPSYVYAVFSKRSPNGKSILDQYNAINSTDSLQYEDYVNREIYKVR